MAKEKLSKYTIGERIVYLRKKRGLSQTDMAKAAGISRSMLYQIETNKKSPTVETLYKLAQPLDINPAIFFVDENTHVFDMENLNKNYKTTDDLNDTLYRAINEIIRYSKKIKLI